MRNVFFAALLLTLLSCTENQDALAAVPATTVKIPLDLSGGRPAVEISVNGGPAALAVFDTGTTVNLIDVLWASDIGLENEGAPPPPFSMDGAFSTTLNNAALSGVPLPPVQAIAMPWNILPGRVAVLGPNIFDGDYVTLDFQTAELRVSSELDAISMGEAYDYGEAPHGLPSIPIRIGTITAQAMLDTGSAYTLLLPLSDADKVPLAAALTEKGRGRGHNGDFPVFESRIDGVVQIGPLSVENPEVRFTDAVPFANVGMEYLQRMIVTVDPAQKRIWVREGS